MKKLFVVLVGLLLVGCGHFDLTGTKAQVVLDKDSGDTFNASDVDNIDANFTELYASKTALDAVSGAVWMDGAGTPRAGVAGTDYVAPSGTAAIATTVTITDNEDTDEENPIVFVAGADPDGGNLGLETDGDCTYNPLYGLITCTAFGGDGSGLTGITASTALDDLTDPDASKTVDINAFTFRLQVDASGAIIIGDYSGGDYMKWNQTYAEFVGDYYLQGSQNLSAVDADGEYGGITDVYTVDAGAAASLFGQAMHIDTDGELICADDDAATTLPFAGALMTAGTGASKSLLVSGKFCETDMNWTVGGVVYVSGDPSTTLGYTQTVPTTNYGQKVGVAVTADCIQLDVGPVVGF